MKHIFLNLKRFDITPELGGVNRLAEPARQPPRRARALGRGRRIVHQGRC